MEHITVLTTGGTIDELYERAGSAQKMYVSSAFAPAFLRELSIGSIVTFDYRFLFGKDDSEITDLDRRKIVEECVKANTSKIIITHGPGTIIQTAEALSAELQRRRTVVLTGATSPACLKETDAEFNLGIAVATCLFAPPGVYIALNGVHRWDQCGRHAVTGIFEPS